MTSEVRIFSNDRCTALKTKSVVLIVYVLFTPTLSLWYPRNEILLTVAYFLTLGRMHFLYFFFSIVVLRPVFGSWPPLSGFAITSRHTTLGRTPLDEWSVRCKRPLPDNTQHSLETDFHALGGIRTDSPTKRAAEDPSRRSRSHCDRNFLWIMYKISGPTS